MGVHHRLMTWCFKFLLLLAVVEASRNIKESDIDLNDRVSKIETKDRHQDDEMDLLKNALNEERKLVHDLTNRVAMLENSNKISGRQKRPYRLLPPHIPREKDNNEMDDESQIRFYGPATGCNDLGRLGYTLNGFYLVREKETHSTKSSSNNRQIEIVECRFRHNKEIGNENHDDKEKRLGFIQINNDGNLLSSRFDVTENNYSKEVNDKERGWPIQTYNSKALVPTKASTKATSLGTQSRSNQNGNNISKKFDELEKGIKVTRVINENESRSTQPYFNLQNDCLYRFKSVALNSCLVVKESKNKKNEGIKTTNLPNYYLDHLSCENVTQDQLWTKRDQYICSNKNQICLTLSYGETDQRAFLKLMAYNAAMLQRWKTKESGKGTAVALMNVDTSLCLHSMNDKKTSKATTTLNFCDQSNLKKESMFYFQQAILKNRKNCPPLKNVEGNKDKKAKNQQENN